MILTHQILFEFWTGATGAAAEQPAYIADWDEPDAGVHPRILVSNVNGPTIAALRSRIAGTHSYFWGQITSFCDSRRSRDNTYFLGQEAEYTGALAFAYMLDNTRTADADRAIELAEYFAGLSGQSETIRREIVVAMAFVYDWCYGRMTSGERATVRDGIADLVQGLYSEDEDEFLWGHAHGNQCHAFVALCAILNDGDSGENTTWRGWMNTILDAFDNGDNDSYWAGFAHFGSTDGGTHKGAGEYSYLTQNERFYDRVMPTMESAIAVPAYANQAWWAKTMHWVLWRWSGDGRFIGHVQHENQQQARWATFTHIHAIQIANREANALGEACQWLWEDIDIIGEFRIHGAWHIYNVLFYDPNRSAVQPTTGNQGGRMHTFRNARSVAIRDPSRAWTDEDVSLVIDAPRFTGGHSKRCGGHFSLRGLRDPMLICHGSYDPDQGETYYEPGYTGPDTLRTGHRYVYYNQAISHNTGVIYDDDEPSENVEDSFRREYNKPNTFFGVRSGGDTISNQGGQLWPKGDGGLYQPGHLGELLDAAHGWDVETFAMEPIETGEFCYVVLDCKPFYYASKVTRYRRHILWIDGTTIDPDWDKPVIVIWDDRVTHIDGDATHGGKKTNRFLLQTNVIPTVINAANFEYHFLHSRLYVKVLSPASVEGATISGYRDLDGIAYIPTKTRAYDDSVYPASAAPFRREIWPAAQSTDVDFLVVLFPADLDEFETDLPDLTLYENANVIGVQFATPTGTRYWTMAKGDTHSASYSTTEPPIDPPTAPFPPTGLQATPGDGEVDLDWDDNGEGDLDYYRVYRRTKLNGTYGAWTLIYSPSTSTYLDGDVVNGTTYQYYVTAVNTVPLESDPSDSTPDVTPQAVPDPPDPPTGQPAIDNVTRSAPMNIFMSLPPYVPAGGSITMANLVHYVWGFASMVPPEPSPDVAAGDPIEDNVDDDSPTPDAGTDILSGAGAPSAGGAISAGTPATGQPITESIEEERPTS